MPYKDPKKAKESQKKRSRKSYVKNKNKYIEQKEIRRYLVLSYYNDSDIIRCKCCHNIFYNHLVIDHINGGGTKHRKFLNGGSKIYMYLIKEKFPEGYQILCHCCNMSKGSKSKCFHINNICSSLNYRQKYIHSIKYEVFKHYCGNNEPFCKCCGENQLEFLTIDHVNGNGVAHRKKIGRRGGGFYQWLKSNKYPSGYQILCANCNFSKGYYGKCECQQFKYIRLVDLIR